MYSIKFSFVLEGFKYFSKYILNLFFFATSLAFSQQFNSQNNSVEEKPVFYLLDVESGLSNNWVTSIEQDSLGFMWIGTTEGLNRYDGTEFKIFKGDSKSDHTSLKESSISQIQISRAGEMYVATPNYLNEYHFSNEEFKYIDRTGLSRFERTSKGEFIYGVYRDGVYVTHDEIISKFYRHNPDNEDSLSSNEITNIILQNDHILWVATENGLNKIDLNSDRTERITLSNDKPSLKVNTVYIDKDNLLWVGTEDGIFTISNSGKIDELNQKLNRFNQLTDSHILCFEEDNQNNMWIGTLNGGLNILNRSNYRIWNYAPKDDGSSVYNRTVSVLKYDMDGNMWIGTPTGLNYINPEGEPIKLLTKNSNSVESISHNRIGAVAESYDLKMWIGTDGSGLDLFDPTTGKFEHYNHNSNTNGSLSSDYVISLLEDSEHRLWAGTYQGGVNMMQAKSGKFKYYLQGSASQGSDVRVLFEDSKNRIWAGTNRGGLFLYNERDDSFDYIETLGKLDIRAIDEDSNGVLWLATYGNGILRYDYESNQSFYYEMSTNPQMRSSVVYTIKVLPNDEILAGTELEGLLRLNPKTDELNYFTIEDGLSNNSVNSIIIENQKSIWLGTNSGISNYNSVTNSIINLNAYNNIQKGKFNPNSALYTRSGVIYLGGEKGLNIFNPYNLQQKKTNLPLVFKSLEVFNQKVFVSKDQQGVLDKSIQLEDHIYLEYSQSVFSLDFTALKYPFAKSTNYFYKIDGYSDEWIKTNGSGRVNLINIPHGDYVLMVKAEYGNGEEVSNQLLITILPPFWLTPIAYLIYVIIISLIIFVLLRYYAERLKLQNQILFEKNQREMEHEFNEERIRFFTSFSHELKTPLTLILAPIEDMILEAKTSKQKKRLNLIYDNAKILLQTINKLLEFRKSSLGLTKLQLNRFDIKECIESWIKPYYPLARKRGITLRFEHSQEEIIAWFDIEKLHIVFNNLLSNAFKYSDNDAEIQVTLHSDGESFELKVRDTGYGIPKEEIDNVFDRYYRSKTTMKKSGLGIGLALTKSFVELHSGKVSVSSKIGKGSTFTVHIPITEPKESESIELKEVNVAEVIGKNDEAAAWINDPQVSSVDSKSSTLKVDEQRELILLIDDSEDILNYLEGLLSDDYDLIFAADGKEGMEKALRYVPDLIVSDVMMPEIDGMQLCNLLKENVETTHIPVVLLTAKGNAESIKQGYQYGADDYIVKPFSGQIFKSRIINILESRKSLRGYYLNHEELNTSYLPANKTLVEQEKNFLNKLDAVIHEQLNQEKVDVKAVSSGMLMSRTSLYRKIKAITGLNINQYITKIKLDRAVILLKSGEYNISQAAFEVGYSNVKYFRKLFKEQFGKLPSEVLKK